MDPRALVLVLVAAVAHASWNLLSKQAARTDSLVYVWLVAAAATVIWSPVFAGYLLLAAPRLTWGGLALIGVSTSLHLGYFVLLQRGYGSGDLSVVYPVARGTGPLLAGLVAILFLGERPTAAGIAGMVLVGVGVFLMSGGSGGGDWRGLAFGLVTGLFIAAYTVWDSRMVGAFGVAPLMLSFLGEAGRALALTPVVLGRRRRALVLPAWREHRGGILAAAALVFVSYQLVLIAFTMAPVSLVAPAREVSVLIAVVLGGRLLAEDGLRHRLLAATVILGGLAAIALS